MKNSELIYIIIIGFYCLLSCNTHKQYYKSNYLPKQKNIELINVLDSVTMEFIGLKFSKEGSDSIFDSSGVKIMFDTSRSVLILETHFDEIIKKTKFSNHKLSTLMKKHSIINQYDLMKLIYNITPNSEIENKELLLDSKELMIQNGVENGFYELEFEWGGKAFQYGGDKELKYVSLDLFYDNHMYLVLFKNFSKEQLNEFLSKISANKILQDL